MKRIKITARQAQQGIYFLILLAWSLVIYFKALSVPFISDDFVFMIDLSNWGLAGKTFFRPLIKWYIDVLKPVFGTNPTGYHICNIVIHAFCGFLVFEISRLILENLAPEEKNQDRKAGVFAAFVISILFVSNFSVSEAVYWVAGVTTLFQVLFILAVIYTYSLYVLKGKSGYLISALILYVLGLGAKEGVLLMAGVIPVLYLSLEFRRPSKRIIWSWVYFWLISGAYLLVANRVFSIAQGGGGYKFQLGWSTFRNLQQYILSSLFQTPFYDIPLIRTQEKILGIGQQGRIDIFNFWFFLALTGFIILFIILLKGKNNVRISFLMLFGSLLPLVLPAKHLSGWFYYPEPARTYYIPLIYIFLIILFFIQSIRLLNKKTLRMIILGCLGMLAICNGLRVHQKGNDWLRVGRQYNHVIKKIQRWVINIKSPNVIVKIVDGYGDRNPGRIYAHGVNLDYNAALYRIYRVQKKAAFSLRAQRYPNVAAALKTITPPIIQKMRDNHLTIFIYHNRNLRRLSPSDF